MRSFFSVLLIFLGITAYAWVFIDDPSSRARERARLEALAITPPAGGGTITLPPEVEQTPPVLTPRPAPAFVKPEFESAPPPAPSPEPSKNKFVIKGMTPRAAPPQAGVGTWLAGLLITPARAQVPQPKPDEIELQFKTGDGQAWAAYVGKREASIFLQSTLRYVDDRRERTKAKIVSDIDKVFEKAFADRDAAVDAFADWYFGFFTSGILAGKGLWGGVTELRSLDLDAIKAAVLIAVKDAIRTEYLNEVMKPEIRDPVIQDGVRRAIMDAHHDYLFMIEGLDARLIEFISENGRFVRPMDPAEKVEMELDWDSESWRAPIHYDREAVMFGAAGVLTTTGAMLAGDVIMETVAVMLGSIIGEAVAAAEASAVGAFFGSEVPVIGTIIGAGAGLGAHAALNAWRDHMGREEFVADTHAAIDATIATWHNMITPATGRLVDHWFDETKKLVNTPSIENKVGS